ncbi:hypothetical protein Tco_0221785 [Tanacetum coccineum]
MGGSSFSFGPGPTDDIIDCVNLDTIRFRWGSKRLMCHDFDLGGKALVERENVVLDLTKSDLCPSFVEDLTAKGVGLCVAYFHTGDMAATKDATEVVGCCGGCNIGYRLPQRLQAFVKAVTEVAGSCKGCHIGCKLLQRLQVAVKVATELTGCCEGCHKGCRLLQRLPHKVQADVKAAT